MSPVNRGGCITGVLAVGTIVIFLHLCGVFGTLDFRAIIPTICLPLVLLLVALFLIGKNLLTLMTKK